jgi:C4-dicarboxylate transporter, DctM subunit
MSADILIWILLFVTLALGVPIYIALGLATYFVLITTNIPLTIIPQVLYTGPDQFPLIAIPSFILAGALMERGGIALEIVEVMGKLVGRFRGGLAIVTVAACAFFAAISGSGPATTAAIGSLMIPAMIKQGYKPEDAGAVSASGGTLGILIPPSNPMIIYGVIGNVSIVSLFIAGVIPGLLLSLMFMGTAYVIARRKGYGAQSLDPFDLKDFLRTLVKNGWSLMMPVIILGSIYTGLCTPVEASIIAVVYSLLVGVFIKRQLNFTALIESLQQTIVISGSVIIIIGTSTLFARVLTMYQVPQRLGELLVTISSDPLVILELICGVLLFLGMFMETLSTIIILTPILLPVVSSLGVDPIHFGIIFVVTNELAFLTPPLGVNLFVVCGLTNRSLERISMAVIPYIITLLIAMEILIFFPDISTILPRILMGK